MRLLKPLFLAILLALSAAPAFAQTDEPPYVHIRLVPERAAIQPGEEITVAVEQSIDDGWHTYWKNPGDSGTFPAIKWTLPENFKIADIEWPVPHRLPYGPLLNYGYEDNVILLQKLKAPDTLPNGPITLKADIDILVCKEICIPESGTYELTLNASGNTEDNAAYIESARMRLPQALETEAVYDESNGAFNLDLPITWSQKVVRYDFIPAEWGVIQNTATPEITETNGRLIIKAPRADRALSDISELPLLILWSGTSEGPMNAFEIKAKPRLAAATAQTSAPQSTQTLPVVLLFALLGGLILNLMPCVFPVLSIKALGLVKIAEKQPALARIHGLTYTAGVMLSFLAVAAFLIALKAGGSKIGWGFQLQSPEIVTLLAWLFFIIGLNLSGIFEIGGHFGNFGQRLTQGGTPTHSFFTGVLATIVATPCTAPFMGVALGFALTQAPLIGLSVFAALGFGLALPYLALSFLPSLQHIMPRPGHWMVTFRQLLAFPMYASAAWLVWVLSQQAGPMGVFTATIGLVLIAFGIWLLRHMPTTRTWRIIVRVLAALAFLVALLTIPGGVNPPAHEDAFGETYNASRLTELTNGNDAVFVEMTAAWCITCKVNHAVALDTASTRAAFKEHNVKYLIGDWTNQDPEITSYLESFGRNGVPIYVYYGPRNAEGTRPEPVVLPQILTPGIVAKTVSTY